MVKDCLEPESGFIHCGHMSSVHTRTHTGCLCEPSPQEPVNTDDCSEGGHCGNWGAAGLLL